MKILPKKDLLTNFSTNMPNNKEQHSERNHERLKKMPLYQKSWTIIDISKRIAALIPEDQNNFLSSYAEHIIIDSSLILTQIAGAESVDLYDLRMEYAVTIRKTARDICAHCVALENFGFKEVEYLQLLCDEVEEFRILFAEWVKSFDQWNYIIDRWGLFNPPGVAYDDKDLDEDYPQ